VVPSNGQEENTNNSVVAEPKSEYFLRNMRC